MSALPSVVDAHQGYVVAPRELRIGGFGGCSVEVRPFGLPVSNTPLELPTGGLGMGAENPSRRKSFIDIDQAP